MASVVLFVVLISGSCCDAADVVFIGLPGRASTEQEQLETAANFYGLNLKIVPVSSAKDEHAVTRAIEGEETVGVAIAADALPFVNQNAVMDILQRKRGSGAALLVSGVTPRIDPTLLKKWSGGNASGCRRLENPGRLQYVFGQITGLTWQLAGLEVPLPSKNTTDLVMGENSAAQPVMSVRNHDQVFPVYVEATVQQVPVFVACATSPHAVSADGEGVVDAFLQIAPAMLFARYCGNERAWHIPHQYANLTIDDPWLRQPYGYVDYEGLLGEMERHNFHTTIAFIPWNFARSEPAIVSLFRNHPERFSITIHGDNHDHKEFTAYSSKPLNVQIADLKQSLARMERFRTLTGIPYDKVMIFPHSIAPEKTLEALKTYNYLATVNSRNVPQGALAPAALSFYLRPVTLSFGGFPSLIRYSVAAPLPDGLIAINEFLGNPLLFYGHADFFAGGIDSFNGLADKVNELDTDTQWRSLGDIVRHFYLVKLRDDSDYDVLAFSSNVCLGNTFGQDAVFYLRKQEIGGQPIESVSVNGRPSAYDVRDGYLNLTIPLAKDKSAYIAVRYKNDLELASVGISHRSLVVYLLRMGSDFRDDYLSKFPGGLLFIHFYDEYDLKPGPVLGFLLFLIALCIYLTYRLHVFLRKRRSIS
jgi:hypothetical protein